MKRDVAGYDELVVAAVVREGRRRERSWREQLGVHPGHSPGRACTALVGEVGSERYQEIVCGALGRLQVDAPWLLLGEQAQRADSEIGCRGHDAFAPCPRDFLRT